jgi:hypothetical protein
MCSYDIQFVYVSIAEARISSTKLVTLCKMLISLTVRHTTHRQPLPMTDLPDTSDQLALPSAPIVIPDTDDSKAALALETARM